MHRKIQAQAFYNIDNTLPGNSPDILPVLGNALAAMATGGSSTLGEAAQLAADLGTTATTSVALMPLPTDNMDELSVQPKSGLNVVLYNENFDIVEANTGILPVDDKINKIQNLSSDRIVIQESGFLEIYVKNDAQTPVYFDNLSASLTSGQVLEVNAYFPYGRQIASLSTKNTYATNLYKYNGSINICHLVG